VTWLARTATLAALAVLSACGLLPPPPPTIRWFSPLPPSAASVAPLDTAAGSSATPLRIRRVEAARHLGERFAWRRGPEVGYLELARWTEFPEALVAHALERELFESGDFVRDGRAALALDVEVRSFEEARVAGKPTDRDRGSARIELALRLVGVGERALLDRSFVVMVPLAGEGTEAFVAAMAEALAGATSAARAALAVVAASEAVRAVREG